MYILWVCMLLCWRYRYTRVNRGPPTNRVSHSYKRYVEWPIWYRGALSCPSGALRSGPQWPADDDLTGRSPSPRFTGFWCGCESCIKRDLVSRTPALYEHIKKKKLKSPLANVYPNKKGTQIRNDACPHRARLWDNRCFISGWGRGAEWEQ